MASSTLVRSRVGDLDQLARHYCIVRVCVFQVATQLRARDERVEHRGAGDGGIHGKAASFAADAYRLVQPNESGRRNQGHCRESMWIARGKDDRVRSRQRRSNENSRLIDHSADEIGDERDVEPGRVADRGALGHSKTEEVDGVNGVRLRQGIDVVAPLV